MFEHGTEDSSNPRSSWQDWPMGTLLAASFVFSTFGAGLLVIVWGLCFGW